MMKRHAKTVLGAVSAVGLAWWLIFGLWLPWRVEASIREFFDEMEVEIDDLDLTWGAGTVSGIRLTGKTLEALSPDVFFTYSPLEWCFGDSNAIELLQVSGISLKTTGTDFSSEVFWRWLETRRLDEKLSTLESLSVEGELYLAGAVCPFEFRGSAPDFKRNACLPFTVEANATLSLFGLEVALPEKLSGTLDWNRTRNKDSAELKLVVTLTNGVRAMVSVSPQAQELTFLLGDEETPELWGRAVRPTGREAFLGDWNATLVTADFLSRWPILALFNLESTAGGDFTWNPATNFFETGVAVVAEVSSFLFREAGVVKAEATARLLLDANRTLIIKEMASEVSDQLGERLEVQARRSWRVGREKALFRVVVDNFRLGRFSTRLPAKVAFSGEADLEVDEEGGLARFAKVALRRSGEDWAIISGIADASFGDEEGASVSFVCECEPGMALLGDLFPEGGFGEVFGKPGVRGYVKLAGGWKEEALEIVSFEGSLATTMNERNLEARGLQPVRISFREGKPILAPAMDEDADVFELSAVNLPLDGMLHWSEGRFQGDLFEGNGTVFFKDDRLGFRCGEVEVENGRILQGSKVLAENLNLRGSTRFVSGPEGGGELVLSGLRLLADGAELARGDLTLTLTAMEEGNTILVTEASSGGLEMNLARLGHFGLPALPNVAEGNLRARNLKISSEKGFSMEMDASLSVKGIPVSAEDEGHVFESGLRLTASESEQGISTWMGLHLDGQPVPTTVAIDLAPKNPVAKLSGENLDLVDVDAFLRALSPADTNGSALSPDAMIRGISNHWRMDLGTLRLPGGSMLTKVAGEANASSPSSIDLNLTGEFAGGTVAASGQLEWVKEEESPRIRNLRIVGRDWNASFLSGTDKAVPSLAGLLSLDANGTFLPDIGFVGETNASVAESSWMFFPDANTSGRVDALSRGLARVLGAEPVLSEDKLRILRRLAVLSGRLDLGEIMFRARRTSVGKVEVVELNFVGDDFLVRGVGEILPDGSLKLSLKIGARGAEVLGAAGMLSEAKKDGDYRILKTDPLVVEGNWREPDFANLWRLLAQGLGLAPE